jgi:hypothetical protein
MATMTAADERLASITFAAGMCYGNAVHVRDLLASGEYERAKATNARCLAAVDRLMFPNRPAAKYVNGVEP